MSGLKTDTAWATNVVSIADFKLFARIDSSDNSTFAAVTNNNYVTGGTVGSTGIWQTIDANGDCNAAYGIGYVGPERYYRVVLDFSGTHGTGTVFGVVGAQSNPLHAPTTEGANL